ncbi:FAST kinase domain-containing protein 5, mitochondrial [Pyxicephalus adspersus]|uniref:RAP domain-containing protein n=1 Tax=Pyxicephalus adspersus TaxID=30357 RepID=A0AAV3ADU6_PYXAD|nr:TPA: hypothetical protein GDO54_009700 [Pyxicephalus adspersus]
MAVVICRRLSRAVFQTAAISSSKWAWSTPHVQLGRNYVFKSAKATACSKDADQNKLDHHGSSVVSSINDRQKVQENEVNAFDNDEPFCVSESPTRTDPSRPQFTLKDKPRDPVRTRYKKTHKAGKGTSIGKYDDIEVYSSKQDPRTFQQHRPEYKSMCYNSEHTMRTSIEEGESILQSVNLSLKPSKVSEFLVKLSYLPRNKIVALKSNSKFHTLCNCSISNLGLYTNSEIISILGAFERLRLYQNHSMLQEYEKEFCLRVQHLSTNELLLVADTFRYMGFTFPKFHDLLCSCMQVRYLDFSLPQVIQLIYIVGEMRHAPQELLEKIDALILRYLTSINLEEIGTVCLGFFKTGNGLSRHLMQRIGDDIVKNVEQISDYALVNVLKMFRFTRVDHIPFLRTVGEDACKRIPNMNALGIMHIVLTFSSMHFLSENLMKTVALAMPNRVSYCRSKDIAKFLWSFGVLQYKPPNANVFYSAFINQIHERLKEFERYPEHFLTCLMGLAFCEQFPFDLIDIALSEKFLKQSSKISLFELKKDLFTIGGTVEIECPEYKGNTISPEFRNEVTQTILELSTQEIRTRAEVIEASLLLPHALGGQEYVKENMILPHTRSKDLEVHLDANMQPVPINSVIEELQRPLKYQNVKITPDLLGQLTNASKLRTANTENRAVKNLENPNIVNDYSMATHPEKNKENATEQPKVTKLAIQVTNRNQYLYQSKQLLGLHALKRRQLRKLGYVVVEIPFWEWFPLTKSATRSEKLAYLHHKVFSAV